MDKEKIVIGYDKGSEECKAGISIMKVNDNGCYTLVYMETGEKAETLSKVIEDLVHFIKETDGK